MSLTLPLKWLFKASLYFFQENLDYSSVTLLRRGQKPQIKASENKFCIEIFFTVEEIGKELNSFEAKSEKLNSHNKIKEVRGELLLWSSRT